MATNNSTKTTKVRKSLTAADLKNKTVRKKLPAYRNPQWMKFPVEMMKGGSLGFRRSDVSGVETWHARVYHDGKYLNHTLGTVSTDFDYKQAYTAALKWAQKVKDSGEAVAKAHTLKDVIDEYLTHLQGNSSPRLMDKRRQADKRLQALIPPALYRRMVNALKQPDVTELEREYSKRTVPPKDPADDPVPISNDAVNRVMVHFRAALNHGYREGMIANNNAWRHYRPKPEGTVKRRSKQYISIEDREAFLNACPAHLRAFCTAMNMTAARPSELRRLRVSDVDLTENHVRLITYKGKRGEAKLRYVPLPEGSAVRMLFEGQIDGKNPDDFVFLTLYGKQWSQANLAKYHNQVRDDKDAPHSKAFETYVWRHCRITDWAKKVPAPEVAAMAGTSLEFIQKNYYKADEDIRAAMMGM